MGKPMGRIEISYDDLQELSGVGSGDIVALRRHEEAIRSAVAKLGRSNSVRWTFAADQRGDFFRLVAYSDRSDCIAQFTRLDLTLASQDLEKLITLGKRPCT